MNRQGWRILLRLSIVAVFVALCVIVIPRRTSKFKYSFELGKPWGYELLTADRDYPILKTQKELEEESQQVLKRFAPYFSLNKAVYQQVSNALADEQLQDDLGQKCVQYLQQRLSIIYSAGMLSAKDREWLQNSSFSKIMLSTEDNVSKKVAVESLYTPRKAYTDILDNAPSNIVLNRLKKAELSGLLVENLTYDTLLSQQVQQSMLSEISLTRGVVQAGERIVDKGDVVTEEQFQLLLSIKKAWDDEGEDETQSRYSLIALILLVMLIVAIFVMYLLAFRRQLTQSTRNILFFSTIIFVVLLLLSLMMRYTVLSVYLVPVVWVAVIVRVFFDSRTAFAAHLTAVLLCSLLVPQTLMFIVIQLMAGIVAVVSLRDITERAQIVRTAGWILLSYALSYTVCVLWLTGDYTMLRWQDYVCFVVNALMVVFAYGLIYLIEKGFGFLSSITLLELTNVNTGLLLEFADKAPGSFQHSVQVGNLAAEAAKAIGANALLVRTGALYHDIGKMWHPDYYTENQQDGFNPLLKMDCAEAAKVVIAHVTEGIRIARKAHLPEVIISLIASHHGTSKVRYFYNTYRNQHPDEPIDEKLFMYLGPKPNTKEAGILMMADAVEARSRSLTEYTEESISQMVEQMIGSQIADGELDETPISLSDIQAIKAVFRERLISINHHRIVYPELKTN